MPLPSRLRIPAARIVSIGLIALAACLGLLPAGPNPARSTAGPAVDHLIPFEIEDQHDARHSHERFAGRALLLAWGDRRGSDFMLAWNRAVAGSMADAMTNAMADSMTGATGSTSPSPPARLDVAHTQGAPFFVKGRIRKRFREDWTDPVLLDWKGRFAAAYDCAPDSCTLLLFDAGGFLLKRWTVGEPDERTLADVTKAAREAASALP